MKTFGDFSRAAADWSMKHNIYNDFEELQRYVWVIPGNAAEIWKTEYDKYVPEFMTQEFADICKKSLEPGGNLFGIPHIVIDDSVISCQLYEMSRVDKPFEINGVLARADTKFPLGENIVSLDYIETNIISVIPSGSVRIKTPLFDGKDRRVSYQLGVVLGEGFIDHMRDHNRYELESLLCTINYRTGDFHVLRNNIINELKFKYGYLFRTSEDSNGHTIRPLYTQEQFHEILRLAMTVDDFNWYWKFRNYWTDPYDLEYIKADIKGTYSYYGNPTTKVFEFNIYELYD